MSRSAYRRSKNHAPDMDETYPQPPGCSYSATTTPSTKTPTKHHRSALNAYTQAETTLREKVSVPPCPESRCSWWCRCYSDTSPHSETGDKVSAIEPGSPSFPRSSSK